MEGYCLYIRLKNDFVVLADGISIGRHKIPIHLIQELNEKQRSIKLYRGWKLREQGKYFIISYHQLVLRIDVNDVDCIQTKPF